MIYNEEVTNALDYFMDFIGMRQRLGKDKIPRAGNAIIIHCFIFYEKYHGIYNQLLMHKSCIRYNI